MIFGLVLLALSTSARRLAVGANFGLFVDQSGTAFSWGSDDYGQLGNGDPLASRILAGPVSGATGVTDVAAGGSTACLIMRGKVFCMGEGALGTTGTGYSANSNVPLRVHGISGEALRVECGFSTCYALTNTSEVYSWGWDGYGQLGRGGDRSVAMPVENLEGVRVSQIVAGGYSVCVLDDSGSAFCAGANGYGQLGTGFQDGNVMRRVPSVVGASTLAVSGTHSCSLTQGQVACWGNDENGKLVAVSGARQVFVSFERTIVFKQDGSVVMAGSVNQSWVPVLQNATELAGNYESLCALTREGAVVCLDGAGGASRIAVAQNSASCVSAALLVGLELLVVYFYIY